MKVEYTKTETRKVEKVVPDCFGWDGTKRGELADLIWHQDVGYKIETPIKEAKARQNLYSSEAGVVEAAIEQLTDAYRKADEIMALLGIENE